MKLQPENGGSTRPQRTIEAGFSLLAALVFVLFIGFVAAGAMHLVRYRYALLGFLLTVIIAVLIASFPDIKRYLKISSM